MFLGSAVYGSYPNATGYQRVKDILGSTLYMRAYATRNSNQILHGDQTISEKNFYRPTTAPAMAEDFCYAHADARSVCDS